MNNIIRALYILILGRIKEGIMFTKRYLENQLNSIILVKKFIIFRKVIPLNRQFQSFLILSTFNCECPNLPLKNFAQKF
jgi:hypothetical protein